MINTINDFNSIVKRTAYDWRLPPHLYKVIQECSVILNCSNDEDYSKLFEAFVYYNAEENWEDICFLYKKSTNKDLKTFCVIARACDDNTKQHWRVRETFLNRWTEFLQNN
jgi:hypothetical protein